MCLEAVYHCLLLTKRDLRSLIVIIVVFVITFGVTLPYVCQDWVYSVYFQRHANDPKYVKQALVENDARLAEADAYFKKQPPYAAPQGFGRPLEGLFSHVDVAIAIVTIDRGPSEKRFQSGRLGYLTQVAHQLHRMVQDDMYLGKKQLFICNVDAIPGKHQEAVSLSRYIPMVSKVTNKTYTEREIFEKEKHDYAFCLVQALNLSPNYVMIVEDDAIPYDHAFKTVHHLLHSWLQIDIEQPGAEEKQWLFMKLYYPEKWQGFSNELPHIVELVSIGVVGASLLIFICNTLHRYQTHRRKATCHKKITVYFLLGVVYFSIMAYTVGRPYVQHLRSVSSYTHHVVPAPDCCTQGILYPSFRAQQLVSHLQSVRCSADFSVDLVIDDFGKTNRLDRYLVEPNLMQHVGLVSTVRGYSKKAAEFIFT